MGRMLIQSLVKDLKGVRSSFSHPLSVLPITSESIIRFAEIYSNKFINLDRITFDLRIQERIKARDPLACISAEIKWASHLKSTILVDHVIFDDMIRN